MAQSQHPQPDAGAPSGRGRLAGPVLRPAHLLPLPGGLHDGPVSLQVTGISANDNVYYLGILTRTELGGSTCTSSP